MTVDADVLIVGAGTAGLVLACALANTQLRILIVEKKPLPIFELHEPYDLRVSAIHHGSRAILQSIKAWDTIIALRSSRYHTMHVWDANSPARIDFDCTEVGHSCLGHIVEHSVLQHALLQQLMTYKNIEIFPATELADLAVSNESVLVRLANGHYLSTRLLVGADGGHSWVAEQAQLSIHAQPYQQSALVATVHTEHSHSQRALQRFLSNGPLAFLPLADPHLNSIVWSTTPADAHRLQQLETPAFNVELTQSIEYELGAVNVVSQRLVFPLIRRHAAQYVKPRIALIGDAAHTLHPLAGQGINLGLLDATCLAQILEEAIKKQRDIGGLTSLRRYERWRKGENALMIAAMQGFKQLFSNELEPIKCLRHAGLSLTAKIPSLKNYLMERAMGLRGDLPKRAVLTL